MSAPWEQMVAKWQEAGLIGPEAAARIREFEQREKKPAGLRWPVIAAVAFGGITLAAGILLFVSAHWDEIVPSTRFAMVVLMVAILHAAGAFAAPRMEALAVTLHGIGTIALGAGIYLCGQIFNMSSHWPSAILMWAAGAWIGWALRRDWLQLSLAAILTPAWLAGEWIDVYSLGFNILWQGILLLAIVYFTATKFNALVWIGGIAFLPVSAALAIVHPLESRSRGEILGLAAAYALPLICAFFLRGKAAWINGVSAVWVLGLSFLGGRLDNPWVYLWCGLGAAGLVAWGTYEHRGERINVGMAGFAITVLVFYFSSVMDKLGRSESLIGIGILFLAGGWALEKLRRRLVAQMRQSA